MRAAPWLAVALLACSPPPASAPVARPAPSPSAAASSSAGPDAWRSVVPKPGRAAELLYPTAETATLANRLELVVVRRAAPVVTLELVVRDGASALPQGKSGLAALTTRMLTEGTRKRGAAQLAEAVESLGATLEHDAGRDTMSVGLTVLREDLSRALDLLAEVVQTPAFAPADLNRVQQQWVDGLVAERQSPDRLASLAGLRLLLGEPHGAPVGGSVPDVKKLTTRDLVELHRTRFVPGNAALVLVGDVALDQARTEAERTFGGWRGAAPAEVAAPPLTDRPAAVRVVDRPGAVQSAIFVAQRLPERSQPAHEVRQLLSAALGGLFTSRINKNLREEHAYTYGARSDAVATRHWGAFVISTSVETGVTGAALAEIVKELGRARDPKLGAPFTEDEIARARADLLNSLGAHLEQTDRIADDLATAFVHRLGPAYYAKLPPVIGQATAARVQSEARRLTPDALVIVVVGDQSKLAPQLAAHKLAFEPAADELIR